MSIFNRSVPYDDIYQVAKDKVHQVTYKGEYIDRYTLLQYIYTYYISKRGSVDLHDAMDVVERFHMSGEIKA